LINDAIHTHKIKSRMSRATAAFNKKTVFATKMDLNLRKKLIKCYVWNIILYGAKTFTCQKVNQKYVEISEM
jgi:hypothetical protein